MLSFSVLRGKPVLCCRPNYHCHNEYKHTLGKDKQNSPFCELAFLKYSLLYIVYRIKSLCLSKKNQQYIVSTFSENSLLPHISVLVILVYDTCIISSLNQIKIFIFFVSIFSTRTIIFHLLHYNVGDKYVKSFIFHDVNFLAGYVIM